MAKRHLESHPGLGYASTLNQHQPKRPNRMISHWWGENFCEFVNTMQLEFDRQKFFGSFAIHKALIRRKSPLKLELELARQPLQGHQSDQADQHLRQLG